MHQIDHLQHMNCIMLHHSKSVCAFYVSEIHGPDETHSAFLRMYITGNQEESHTGTGTTHELDTKGPELQTQNLLTVSKLSGTTKPPLTRDQFKPNISF